MVQEPQFGRRGIVGARAEVGADLKLPSLEELGFTAGDGRAEVAAFKKDLNQRRFKWGGGWIATIVVSGLGLTSVVLHLNGSPHAKYFLIAAITGGFVRQHLYSRSLRAGTTSSTRDRGEM